MYTTLSNSSFKKRQQLFIEALDDESIAIIPTAKSYRRNGDADFVFRADSNFLYLTGFTEPEAIAVFIPGRKQGEYILFNREKDPQKELWEGKYCGQEDAKKLFGADEAYPIKDFSAKLADLLPGHKKLYFPIGHHQAFDEELMGIINTLRRKVRSGMAIPEIFINVNEKIGEMRLIKSEEEIAVIRHVTAISANAHVRAMRACQNGLPEYALEADILHEFFRNGCRTPAYSSIVGGGGNACVLHYTANSDPLKNGDLVLIDAGAEYLGYAADITRTFPVNGTFSPEQKAIYHIVLNAQLAGIATVKPGVRWNQIQEKITHVITEGLVSLGILKGDVSHLIAEKAFLPFYMHNSGHWLGLDVHDAGRYKLEGQWRTLQAGMVLTVEPGIYISEQCNVDHRWKNIGIRIEDDVLVTEQGCEILTSAAPKTIPEIEALMKKQ